MRFIIRHSGCGTERVAYLTGFKKSSTTNIDTPSAALFTQGGSVVHLTVDVLSKVFSTPQLLWVPLANSIRLEQGVKAQGEGVAKFSALSEHITCASLHSVSEKTPLKHFEPNLVPLWTKQGKQMISADRYMDIMEVFKPDMIVVIADDKTSLSDGVKRMKKAVERTNTMLNSCVERYKSSKHLQGSSLIGVIVGAADTRECQESIQNVLKHKDSIAGVAIGGLTDGTHKSEVLTTEQLEKIFKSVGENLPADLVRLVQGCWNPAIVMAAIQHGWDLFDGSYPLSLTNKGHALTLEFDVNKDISGPAITDLNSDRYKEDFSPIVAGCKCLACQKHTRAYIRHLLNTREMLASVLLNIHNLHHFSEMFVHARRHISEKSFSIFRELITQQYEPYRASLVKCGDGQGADEPEKVFQMKKKPRLLVDNVSVPVVNGSSDISVNNVNKT